MSSVPRQATSYEQVPYVSQPYRDTHPSNLAALGILLGMSPRPVEQSRVLELGCAAGGNLLPMAEQFPTATFLGIDSSERQMADGNALLRELPLANIELRHASLADIDASWGVFDFIICHGVYSWVPDAVRQHMLKVCAQNLSPSGVAYVSYNTYPGWHTRGIIRELMCFRGRKFDDPAERIAAGRGALDLLTQMLQGATDPYSQLLQREAKMVRESRDHYLFHDHISQHNQAVYFHEFVEAAGGQGLQYLSEANAAVMSLQNPQMDRAIQSISSDVIELEQYMDFVRNRAFRQTLLCHSDVALNRTAGPERLAGLYLSSPAKSETGSVDLAPRVAVKFRHSNGLGMSITAPLAKAALMELSSVWPMNVQFADLVGRAANRLGAVPDDGASKALGNDLLRIYGAGGLELSASAATFVTEPSLRPASSPLARLQAQRQSAHITNRRHEMVELAEPARRILALLDGTRDIPAIAQEVSDRESSVDEWVRSMSKAALLVK